MGYNVAIDGRLVQEKVRLPNGLRKKKDIYM